MSRIERFEDLQAWQLARFLVKAVYAQTQSPSWKRQLSLADQLERAVVSIMSNIAEGFERLSDADKTRFFSIARASCGEVRSLIYVAEDIALLNKTTAVELRNQTISVGKLISGLMNYLRSK